MYRQKQRTFQSYPQYRFVFGIMNFDILVSGWLVNYWYSGGLAQTAEVTHWMGETEGSLRTIRLVVA